MNEKLPELREKANLNSFYVQKIFISSQCQNL